MQADKEVFEQTEEGGMTAKERLLLIEYLEKQGWTSEQILDLLKYISK